MIDHLYHYTNLETLKLILHNKTFRLSSLNKMDDLEEGDTEDFQKLGRFVYISSWTSNPKDVSHLWKEYTKGNDGIRIRMQSDIFKTERLRGNYKIHGETVEINDRFAVDLMDLMKEEDIMFAPPSVKLLEVKYTDEEHLLKQKVCETFPNGHFHIKTRDLGLYKRSGWQDQREWRYRLSSIPLNVIEFMSINDNRDRLKLISEKLKTRQELEFIDLPLKEDVFEDLQIMCSPHMSDDSKQELKEVLAKYAPNSEVIDSKLRIRN